MTGDYESRDGVPHCQCFICGRPFEFEKRIATTTSRMDEMEAHGWLYLDDKWHCRKRACRKGKDNDRD